MGHTVETKKASLKEIAMDAMLGFEPAVQNLFNKPTAICRIDTRERDWARGIARDYSERVSVMGDPLWYMQVLHVGPTTVHKETSDGQLISASHRFAIMLFFEFLDAPREEDSSTNIFEAMTDGVGDPCGLLPWIRAQGVKRVTEFDVRGHPIHDGLLRYKLMEDDIRSVVPVESTGTIAQHVFTTEVEVRDQT